MSGAAKAMASRTICARCPSRATWTSTAGRSAPPRASARAEIGQDEAVEAVGNVRERDVLVGVERLGDAAERRRGRRRTGGERRSLLGRDDAAG